MKTYLAYIRVSTVKQGEHGSSLQEQKGSIEAYAVKHGLSISGWYEEMETAAKLGRTKFNRMLADLAKGKAVGVIIHKIDRSARNLKDWAQLGELIDQGLEVHFAHESLDLASRGGRLAADIQAVVAADYIRNLRQEVLKGFYGRLKQGYFPLPAPRGYLNQGKAKPKTIDPIVGPLVREAFELYATGQYSIYTLSREMSKRGLTGGGGKPLVRNAVARMLHNPFYMGVVRIERTGETFQGLHEPLVRAATFNRVQAIMAGRYYARPRKNDLLFRRLLKCAGCGYGLVGEVQKGHTYYRCHTRSCRGTSIRETSLLQDICAYFQLFRFSEKDMGDFRDLARGEQADRATEASARRAENRRLLALCEGRLARLTDAFLDGSLEKDLFESRKAGLFNERRTLRDAIEQPVEDTSAQSLLKKLELAHTAQTLLESQCVPEIRERLQMLTSNLTVLGKELTITPQFPFADILKWQFSHNGPPHGGTPRNGVTLCTVASGDDRTLWLDLTNATQAGISGSADELLRVLIQHLDGNQNESDAPNVV